MARAIVLSAGLGTRLRPLTNERPKALVPLGDRSLAWHIVEHLARAGFGEVVMNTHHLSEAFPLEVSAFPVEVHLIHEPRIRGTAGGIAGARGALGPAPVIAWNADILAEPPLEGLLASAQGGGLCLAVSPRAPSEGTVGVGADGRVVRLRGKSFGPEVAGGDYVGVAALGARILHELPSEGCLIGDVALPLLACGDPIVAVSSTAPWRDVGSLTAYLAANLEWLSNTHGELASWVHPSARVSSDVRLERCIVGAGAVVAGEGTLSRTVVWPSAAVRAPLDGVVVTTSGAVVEP
jgi:mannose-1-phosphate guanylyltransferase